MLQTAMSEMGCGSFVRCLTVRLAVLLRLNVFVVAALFVVAPSTAMAAANCGEKNERACCLKERDIKGVGGLNDCEKNLYQVPGCDPKERNCGCSNSVFNSAGVCRSPQWIVEHSKQVSAKMLADAKKVVAEIEAEAKKASAETKRIAEEAACKASVAALSNGKLPPGVSAPSPRPPQPNPEVAMKVTVDFLKANKMLGPNNEVIDNPLVTELMRLRKNANNAKAEVKKLFSP